MGPDCTKLTLEYHTSQGSVLRPASRYAGIPMDGEVVIQNTNHSYFSRFTEADTFQRLT